MSKKYQTKNEISLSEAQELCKKILGSFHEFCINHNITYYVMFGTLLGAVRHKDIIPWDHDVDTIMIRSEYNKLLKLSYEFYNETGYRIINYTNRKHMPVCFSRIIDSNYSVCFDNSYNTKIDDSIYIDVFVLDKGPEDDKKMISYYKKFSTRRWILSMKYNYYQPNFLYRLIKTFFRIVFIPFRCKTLCNSLIKTAYNPKYDQSNNVFVIDDYFRKRQNNERYLFSDFGIPVLLPFGDLNVYAPQNYVQILTNRYGDYMKLPPKESRKCYAHFYRK